MQTTKAQGKERTLEEINEAFSQIPKFIVIKKGKVEYDYRPFIFKLDNDHTPHGYIACYCSYNKIANPNNNLFAVKGRTLVECLGNFLDKFEEMKKLGKIKDKKNEANCRWIGEKFRVDFLNDDF